MGVPVGGGDNNLPDETEAQESEGISWGEDALKLGALAAAAALAERQRGKLAEKRRNEAVKAATARKNREVRAKVTALLRKQMEERAKRAYQEWLFVDEMGIFSQNRAYIVF